MFKHWFIAFSIFCSSMGYASQLPNKPHIYVEGSAEIEVEPDIATFRIGLHTTGKDAEKEKTKIDEHSVTLVNLCKKMGININDIAATGINVSQAYEYDKKEQKRIHIGVHISRTVEITLREMSKYKDLMHHLTAADVSEDISSNLSLDNEKLATDQALATAINDATKRATSIAKLQNVELGEVYSVTEFNLRQPERSLLHVSRKIEGQLSSSIFAEDMGKMQDSNMAQAMSRISTDPFNTGKMKAKAQVYMVFLIQ